MLNNFIYNIPYLLFFIPLLVSIVVCIAEKNKVNLLALSGTLGISAILLFIALINMNVDSSLFVSIRNAESLIGGEFRITNMGLLFSFGLVVIHLIIFFNTNREFLKTKKHINLTHRKYFFMTYLLNIFSLFGLIFTSNICNYFLFLEIYSFTMYIIVSEYKTKEDIKNSFNYFLNSICGSIIVLLSIFSLCIFFNSYKMIYISQKFLTINLLENITLMSIVALFFIGLILKFYSLNIVFYNRKSNREARNLLSYLVIFINSPLSIYSILYFTKYVFNIDYIFSVYYVKYTLIVLSTAIILYSCFNLIKKCTLHNFVIRSTGIYVSFIVVSIALNNAYSTYLSLLFIFEHITLNFLFYLLYNYFIEKHQNMYLNFDKDNQSRFVFYFLMCIKIFLPVGVMYYINNIVLFDLIYSSKYIMLVLMIITRITYIIFLIKNLNVLKLNGGYFVDDAISYSDDIVKRKINILKYSSAVVFVLILISTFTMGYLKVVFYN